MGSKVNRISKEVETVPEILGEDNQEDFENEIDGLNLDD